VRITRLLVAFAALALGFSTPVYGQEPSAEAADSLAYTLIYADSTGASHFADEAIYLASVLIGGAVRPTPGSILRHARGLAFFCPPPGTATTWYRAPRRQFNLVLSGEFIVQVSSGESRRFGPGGILLTADTVGQGHRTSVIGSGQACFASVAVPEQE
jgi:hypothetical protein